MTSHEFSRIFFSSVYQNVGLASVPVPQQLVGSPFSQNSNTIQKLHNSGVEDADYSQKLPLGLFSATASSVVLPMVSSNTGLSHRCVEEGSGIYTYAGVAASNDAGQPSWAPMPMSFSFPPHGSSTHSIYHTMQQPFCPPMAAYSLLTDDLSYAIDQPLATHLPIGHPPGQWNPPQACVSSLPSRNSQVQSLEARERPIHDPPNSAADCRARSARYSPYRRPQKKGPAVEFEPDVKQLQHRCKEAGAEEQAVLLIEKVFQREVKLASLTRKLTTKELASRQFGGESGQAYVCFLRVERDARNTCRLCPRGTEMSWKHRRDVLRHLRRDHFGLADKCPDW